MKKFFFTLLAAVTMTFASATVANAQSNSCQEVGSFSVKPFVGLSGGILSTKNQHTDMRTGFTAGVEGQYQFSKVFALSAGVAYQQQGGKIDGTLITEPLEGTYKLDYVNVPIMANFYVCKGLALKIGVQPGFAVNTKGELKSKTTGQTASSDLKDQARKFDLAIPVGISYEYSNVVLDARINAGAIGLFKAIDASDNLNAKNGVFQLTVGYRF